MDDPGDRQAACNASRRGQWAGFDGHRGKASALLGVDAAPPRTRLCVRGAGDGNDLDLPTPLAAHREVPLVDPDQDALTRGAARQGWPATAPCGCTAASTSPPCSMPWRPGPRGAQSARQS